MNYSLIKAESRCAEWKTRFSRMSGQKAACKYLGISDMVLYVQPALSAATKEIAQATYSYKSLLGGSVGDSITYEKQDIHRGV